MKPKNQVFIINDGAIATKNIGNGRFIPGLILDTKNCSEFDLMVDMQHETGPGDVVSTWGYNLLNQKTMVLKLQFTKPMDFEMNITFNLRKQGILVDRIIRSSAVLLQSSKHAKSISEGINLPKLIIEVNPSTKLKNWENLYEKNIKRRLLDEGIDRKKIKLLAKNYIKRSREIFDKRLK